MNGAGGGGRTPACGAKHEGPHLRHHRGSLGRRGGRGPARGQKESGRGSCEHPGKRGEPGQGQAGERRRGCVSPECPRGAHLTPTRINRGVRLAPRHQPPCKYAWGPGDGAMSEAGPRRGTKTTEPPNPGVQQGRPASLHARRLRESPAREGSGTTQVPEESGPRCPGNSVRERPSRPE